VLVHEDAPDQVLVVIVSSGVAAWKSSNLQVECAIVSKEAAPPGGFVKFDDQEIGAKRTLTTGDDLLGGRAWDCTEALHIKMLEYAMRGDIPITKPEQRARLARKKPTFHGAPAWRDAVKMGYIHPDIAPPKGYTWKRVSIGWKLLELEPPQ